MYQAPSNEEIIALQAIEKELSSDPTLQNICKQIGSANQNPRLLTFLSELFKLLFNSYVSADFLQKTVRILNTFLNKQKFKNKEIQESEISHFIEQKYYDVLANFYERAFLRGHDEARRHKTYIYYKKIVFDYLQGQPQNQNQQLSKSIIAKMDQLYQNFQGAATEFEMALFDQLKEQESDLFYQIVQEDQAKAPKLSNPSQDRFLQSLPLEIQEKFKSLNCEDFFSLKEILVREKANNQSYPKAIERIQGYIFVDKLNSLLNQHYLTCQVQKIRDKKGEIQKKMGELEKDCLDPNKEYKEFLDIPNVKYLYKSFKLKRINVQKSQSFSFRAKLMEYIKQEINSIDWPKKCRPISIKKNWLETYKDLYSELSRITNERTTNDEGTVIFNLIINIQQIIITFLKFRWNYLFLFCVLTVEMNFPQQELEKLIDIVFEMMQTTTKANLGQTFDQILQKLNDKASIQISTDSHERNAIIQSYLSVQYLENQLLHVNNKIIKLFLRLPTSRPQKLYEEVLKFEYNFIAECNESLRSHKKLYDKLTDSILEGEREEKDAKANFFRTYSQFYQTKIVQITQERTSNKLLSNQFNRTYSLSVTKLKQDYQKKALGPYQEILAREEKICSIIEMFLTKEAEKLQAMQQQQQSQQVQEFKEFLLHFIDIFIKDNSFIFYLPQLFRCVNYIGKRFPYSSEKIERVKYAAVAFKDKDINEIGKFIDQMSSQKDPFNFEYQFKIASQLYNFYITQPYITGDQQLKPWNEQFPNQINNISELNSPQYNTLCVITSKLYGNDFKMMIRSEEQLKGDLIKKISQFLSDKTALENQQERAENNSPHNLYQTYQDLKLYKGLLIKEVLQSNDQTQTTKYQSIFLKSAIRSQIITEVIEYKRGAKIHFNEIEQLNTTKQYWNSAGQSEIKNYQNDQGQKKRIEDYFKTLFQCNSQQLFYDKLLKDCQNNDPLIKQILTKHLPKYQEDLEKNTGKGQPLLTPSRQPILQMQVVQKRLSQIRSDVKFKDFASEDQQVFNFINEQFSLYMKQLLGKVLQTVLTQKPGYEFKVYQNKPISPNDTLQLKYKQQLELQAKYGPQKNSQLETSLLISTESKTQLFYELCDYTPAQRQAEFRNFLTDVEPHLEEKLKNKIRKSKWKEEHPELEDILKKRIKRGAELWNQVQDFLCKRENNDYMNDSEEEEEKNRQQQQQQADNIDDEQLDIKIQELQKASEKQLVAGKNNIRTRLNNMENDNHLLTQKAVTVKTLQYVLEQHPYFRKSRVLYKSYIL